MHHRTNHCCGHFLHRITCEHQIEIEIFPASAEVYFADERYADPAMIQARFDVVVYNAPTAGVHWSVAAINGGPGAGSIDQTGLYTAPPKGALPSASTDVIIAEAADNPDRKAFAFVSLIGKGPEPPPTKQVLLSPKRCFLYDPIGNESGYIDESNTLQVFRAIVSNSDDGIDWLVNGAPAVPGPLCRTLYCYDPMTAQPPPPIPQPTSLPSSSTWPPSSQTSPLTTQVLITARLSHDHSVYDDALVVIGNYFWQGLYVQLPEQTP
jgi:hypothetical protein